MKCIREHGCGSARKILLQVETIATVDSACHMAEEPISHILASFHWTAEVLGGIHGDLQHSSIYLSVSLQVKPFKRPIVHWDSPLDGDMHI